MAFISVAIPTVKRANYLRAGLRSIFSQTRLPDEVVISIDGQDPATIEVIESFQNEHPAVNVRYALCVEPIGEWANRQQAFRMSTGEYVAMLDDDDMWHPDFLEKTYDALLRNPDCGFCFGKNLLMDPYERALVKMTEDVEAYTGRSEMKAGKLEDLLGTILTHEALPFPLSCTLFRRSALEKVGFFPPYAPALPDLTLFLELGMHGVKGYFIDERLGRYRVHDGQASAWRRILNSISKIECFREFARKYGRSLPPDRLRLLKLRYRTSVMECAISHIHEGKLKEGLSYLKGYFRLGYGMPSFPRTVVLIALLLGVRNKNYSFFRNETPKFRYDDDSIEVNRAT